MTTNDTQPFDEGVTAANAERDGQDQGAYVRECADVKRWRREIEAAREFDKHARKRYAIDRRYASATRTHFAVEVPIAQSYIDVMRSFLYARDPDLDVTPTGLTEPPPQKVILAMVADRMKAGQSMQGAASLPASIARLMGTVGGTGASPALPGGPAPAPAEPDEQTLQAQVAELLKPYQQLRDDAQHLGTTIELVVAALWKKAKLKKRGKRTVGSALTVAIGWLKACWLERMGRDPVIQQQLDDIHENLARMAQLKREIDEGQGNEDEAKAELEQQAKALEANVEVVVARGFAIDFVAAEDIQVSTDVSDITEYLDASWIAHRVFMTLEQAKQDYPDIADKLTSATAYYPQRPQDTEQARDSGSIARDVDAADADSYRKGGESGQTLVTSGHQFVCLWEVWNRDASTVLTFFEGMECYAKQPFNPTPATTRFYAFFQYVIGQVDGQRHPRSLIARSEKLLDEYNGVRTGYRKHRQRVLPKQGFDATNYSPEEIAKLTSGDTAEMVPLKPTRPGEDVSKAVTNISYPAVDMALYDTSVIRAELEMIWGIQEALSSSIHTAKTATEAEIQKEGTNSRTGYMRDDLDEMLTDLAQYTAEVALGAMSADDVKEIAGPWSLWPEKMTVEDLASLVQITIHAGSTGKPDTAAQRQAWSALLPQLTQAIQQVGQLRGSSDEEIADCLEALIVETVSRTGDRIDATRFLPGAPRTPKPPAGPAQPLQETVLMGPQIEALTGVLADVRGGVITPASAVALIHAVAPAVPQDIVAAMVQGSTPRPGDPPTQLDAPHATTTTPPAPMPGPAAPIPEGVTA